MRLHVDWTACDGRGVCAELLPERITEDDWGYPVIRDPSVPKDLEGLAGRAVDRCPRLALTMVRD